MVEEAEVVGLLPSFYCMMMDGLDVSMLRSLRKFFQQRLLKKVKWCAHLLFLTTSLDIIGDLRFISFNI